MCVCVCVSVCMTGIHASKRRKEVVCLEGDENICDFFLGCLDKQFVFSSPLFFFSPPPPPFPFLIRQSCRRETTYTYFVGKIGHFTPPVHISLSSHKNLASEDQSVPSARLRLDRTDRCTRVLSHICSRIRAAKKKENFFPPTFP